MNNDLVSREWLKDAFDNLCCHNCKICRNFRNEDSFYKCKLIETAPVVPQVNVFCENADEKAIADLKAELQSVIEDCKAVMQSEIEDRPQGEWYFSCEKGWECNQCHEVVKEMPTCMRKATYNFCPNCGAKMKGGAE